MHRFFERQNFRGGASGAIALHGDSGEPALQTPPLSAAAPALPIVCDQLPFWKLLWTRMALLIRVWLDLLKQMGQRIRDRSLPNVVVIGAQSVPEKYSHLAVQRGFALRRSLVGGRGVVRRHGPPFLFPLLHGARPNGATLIAQPEGCELVMQRTNAHRVAVFPRFSLPTAPLAGVWRPPRLDPLRDHLPARGHGRWLASAGARIRKVQGIGPPMAAAF